MRNATTQTPSATWLRQTATIITGVALITLCAKLRIPSWPVPMTLHTLAVMGLAIGLGPRLATATFFADWFPSGSAL